VNQARIEGRSEAEAAAAERGAAALAHERAEHDKRVRLTLFHLRESAALKVACFCTVTQVTDRN